MASVRRLPSLLFPLANATGAVDAGEADGAGGTLAPDGEAAEGVLLRLRRGIGWEALPA